MDCRLTITIPGVPVPKGRPRLGRGRTFTPEKTKRYERLVATCGITARPVGFVVDDRVWSAEIVASLPVPEGWPIWKRRAAIAGLVRPTGKPDADNLIKSILDGLNGVIWQDDSSVVDIRVSKRYADLPGVVVTCDALPAIPAASASKMRVEAWGQLATSGG